MMKTFYDVFLPNEGEDRPIRNVPASWLRKNLPKGTHVQARLVGTDGSVYDRWEVPVIDGCAQFGKRIDNQNNRWDGR